MKFKSAAVVALLAVPLTIASCSAPAGGGSDADAPAEACAPGITDTEIRFGTSVPLSGPLAAFGSALRGAEGYLESVNAAGGITSADGKTRKVTLILKDDGYDPARTVQNARELVERENVFALFGVLGTSNVLAANEYLEPKGIPQIYVNSGAPDLRATGNPNLFGWNVPFDFETDTVASAVVERIPNAKVGLLYPANGFGEAFVKAFEESFEEVGGAEIVAMQSYDAAATTVDSQVVALKDSGADVFLNYALGAFTPAAMRKAHEIGWDALQVVNTASNQLASAILPAGPEASDGVISVMFAKDSNDPQWEGDAGIKEAHDILAEYAPDLDRDNSQTPYLGVLQAQLLVDVLEKMDGCTHESLMESVRNTDEFESGLLLPGITITTTPDGIPAALTKTRMGTFDGETWTIDDQVFSAPTE